VACVVTQILVHADDPAFTNPTKPIGPYYLRDDEVLVKKAKGWKMAYDQRGGWRRIVPSPRPVDVIEKDIIRTLVGNGEGRLMVAEAKKHLAEGQFPPGSMGPKVEAVVDFLEHGGQHAVITDLGNLATAVAGKAGTQIGRA